MSILPFYFSVRKLSCFYRITLYQVILIVENPSLVNLSRQHWTPQGCEAFEQRSIHADSLAVAAAAVSLQRGRLRVQGRAHLHRCRHGDLLGDLEWTHLGRLPA